MKPLAKTLPVAVSAAVLLVAASAHAEKANPERNVYFGDTHAHSELSGDAYGFGNRLPPENAYRLARRSTTSAATRSSSRRRSTSS